MASFSDSSYFYRGKLDSFTLQKKISKAKPRQGCRTRRTTIKAPRQRRAQNQFISYSIGAGGRGVSQDMSFLFSGIPVKEEDFVMSHRLFLRLSFDL